MENKKYILLLLVSASFLSYFADAVCVPRRRHANNSSVSSPTPSPSTHISVSPSESPEQQPFLVSSPKMSMQPSSDQHSGSFKHSFTAFPSHVQNPVLDKICGVTDHPEACIASVSPFITAGLSLDALSVLQIEIKALLNGFEKAMATAKIMMNNPSTPALVKSCLDTCLDVYDSGVGDLQSTVEAISSRDIYRLQTLLSSTISYAESCEDSFAEQSIDESPMKKVDEELNMLASNNLAIATLLKWT